MNEPKSRAASVECYTRSTGLDSDEAQLSKARVLGHNPSNIIILDEAGMKFKNMQKVKLKKLGRY